MMITLWDMDVEYSVLTDTNAEGKDFVRIKSGNSDDENDICLDKEQCLELARVLRFISKELKEE